MSETHDARVGRRTVLRSAAGLAGAGAALGTAGTTAAAEAARDQQERGDASGAASSLGEREVAGSDAATVDAATADDGGLFQQSGGGSSGGFQISPEHSLMIVGILVGAFLSPVLFGLLLLRKYDERGGGESRGETHGHGPQ
ncbi:MAG: hypothetical protein ABEJ78_02185 [Haloferacaceae archaeon]